MSIARAVSRKRTSGCDSLAADRQLPGSAVELPAPGAKTAGCEPMERRLQLGSFRDRSPGVPRCRENRTYDLLGTWMSTPSPVIFWRPRRLGMPRTGGSRTPRPATAPPSTGGACNSCPGSSPATRTGRPLPVRRQLEWHSRSLPAPKYGRSAHRSAVTVIRGAHQPRTFMRRTVQRPAGSAESALNRENENCPGHCPQPAGGTLFT